jgi:DNA-binding response OmpR family regulator
MVRPCFLVVDLEHASSISTRKLVIETAKFNVITAYSAREALDTSVAFPAINGVVLDATVKDLSCTQVIRQLKAARPDLPIIIVRGPEGHACEGADHYLDSFEPARLLNLLRSLQPQAADAIEHRNEELAREESGNAR